MGLFGKILSGITNADLETDTFTVTSSQWRKIPSGSVHWPGFFYIHHTHDRPINLNRESVILVYQKVYTEWLPISNLSPQSALSSDMFMYSIGPGNKVTISIGAMGAPTGPQKSESFTVISVKASARRIKPDIDLADYAAVLKAYG